MPRALSLDLRRRIVEAVEAGASCRSVALRFSVAVSTVIKLMQAYRATGSIAPKQMGGYKKSKLEPYRQTVLALVEATPDATLAEHLRALKKLKIKAKRSSLARFLDQAGLSFKKNSARQRARPA